ncbi:MAG: Hsp70 family protein, partial [Deltaproteobacteria bacterium]|nr:Hsp70 family protein [Deltaproteobacteria bacterium]
MEPVVGIDLGTTNSEIAFIIDGNAKVLKDKDNGIVPSCVGLDNQGNIITGVEARNQAAIAPDRTVLSVKRSMGSETKFQMNDSSYLPQEISAFILKALKQRAEKLLDKKISKAVITVPAYFTDAQRQATRDAGAIAGLDVIRIINEPTAAALAYESTNPKNQRILVYDLGGGTFDVSIVKIEQGIVEVLSSTGDNHLGGDDFDQKIVDLLVEHIEKELKLTVAGDPVVMARLKHAAEKAKITLSSEPYARIEEDHIGKKAFKDIHLSFELSRTDFDMMIEDALIRTMESVNKALKDASSLPSAIDTIILVGGSTRIPKISDMLEEKFNIIPHSEIDPDLCVGIGAAIQAGREMGLDSSSVLLDITPYTFGTSAV